MKSICHTRNILHNSLCFQVGNGINIEVMKHPWLPGVSNFLPVVKQGFLHLAENLKVKDQVVSNGWNWNLIS